MQEYLYNELINLPSEIKKLVDINVEIEMKSNNLLHGYLKTIDPVSHALVIQLTGKNCQHINLKLIPAHAIKKLRVQDSKIDESSQKLFKQFISKKLEFTSTDKIKKIKDNIIRQLEKNKFPCRLDALKMVIIVGDICKINPPYREIDIECENYKVAKNLKNLLKGILFDDDYQ